MILHQWDISPLDIVDLLNIFCLAWDVTLHGEMCREDILISSARSAQDLFEMLHPIPRFRLPAGSS